MSLWKLINARWGSSAGETDEVRIDAVTNSLQVINFSHHEVHEGDSFGCIGVVDLANGAVLDLQITTPNTTKWLHFTISYDTESEIVFEFYENPTINTPGTTLAPIHHNRNKTGTASGIAGGGLASIENTNTANAEADTAKVEKFCSELQTNKLASPSMKPYIVALLGEEKKEYSTYTTIS